MYVVRRTFRGPFGVISAGSVIQPADIKMFKYRLQQKHIVEITEQNFERYNSFFKVRLGINIPTLKSEGKAPKQDKAPEEPKQDKAPKEEKAPEEPKQAKAKAAKATVKAK
jgi:TPP-dependent 2-oxoacid decarboxylase